MSGRREERKGGNSIMPKHFGKESSTRERWRKSGLELEMELELELEQELEEMLSRRAACRNGIMEFQNSGTSGLAEAKADPA